MSRIIIMAKDGDMTACASFEADLTWKPLALGGKAEGFFPCELVDLMIADSDRAIRWMMPHASFLSTLALATFQA